MNTDHIAEIALAAMDPHVSVAVRVLILVFIVLAGIAVASSFGGDDEAIDSAVLGGGCDDAFDPDLTRDR